MRYRHKCYSLQSSQLLPKQTLLDESGQSLLNRLHGLLFKNTSTGGIDYGFRRFILSVSVIHQRPANLSLADTGMGKSSLRKKRKRCLIILNRHLILPVGL